MSQELFGPLRALVQNPVEAVQSRYPLSQYPASKPLPGSVDSESRTSPEALLPLMPPSTSITVNPSES